MVHEPPRVLIVDDDTELCELLGEYLRREGYAPEFAHDGLRGGDKALTGGWALVVLDVMLPGRNGLDVLRMIRESSAVPVIMLTARGEPVDRIVGLELGADDYVPKPFNPRELVARMRAVLRRGRDGGAGAQVVRVGDLTVDEGARVVRCGSEEVVLTGTEFSLLDVLARSAGHVVSRDELSRQVLGRRAASYDRSLDVHVSNLRRKLGVLPDGGERIKTVRGAGYVLVRPAD